MAQIDKLIEKMVSDQVERVVLISDEPMQFFRSGIEAKGRAISFVQLDTIIKEIAPVDFEAQLTRSGKFEFAYSYPTGASHISLTRSGQNSPRNVLRATISLNVAQDIFDDPWQSPQVVVEAQSIEDDPEVQKMVERGSSLNQVGAFQKALPLLEKAYKLAPTHPKVAFELGFSYNALKKFQKAVVVLGAATNNEPRNYIHHRELAFSYLGMKNYQKSIKCYENGLALCPESLAAERSEMAANLALAYEKSGNPAVGRLWMEKARKWAPVGTAIWQQLKVSEVDDTSKAPQKAPDVRRIPEKAPSVSQLTSRREFIELTSDNWLVELLQAGKPVFVAFYINHRDDDGREVWYDTMIGELFDTAERFLSDKGVICPKFAACNVTKGMPQGYWYHFKHKISCSPTYMLFQGTYGYKPWDPRYDYSNDKELCILLERALKRGH